MELIAEFGQSHGGNMSTIEQQVALTADAGFTHYKTQLLTPEEIAAAVSPLYWKNTLGERSQREAFARAGTLDYDQIHEVKGLCSKHGVGLVVSPFDHDALNEITTVRANRDIVVKIASGEITNLPFLRQVAATKAPTILSTGAANEHEIEAAISLLAGSQLTVMACTLEYPSPLDHADVGRVRRLRALRTVDHKTRFIHVGYSDHTSDPLTAAVAVGAGATMLEVHCTLDSVDDPELTDCADDMMALDPAGMKQYADTAKRAQILNGHSWLECRDWEQPAREGARRCWHVTAPIAAGTILTADHKSIGLLRPHVQTGLPPSEFELHDALKTTVDLQPGDVLTPANTT